MHLFLLLLLTGCPAGDSAAKECFVDDDGDGWGTGEAVECTDTVHSSYDDDCDDQDDAVHPGVDEVCDGVDNNCDGAIDEGLTSTWYLDADSDGYGYAYTRVNACTAPDGYVLNNDDCDDGDADISPAAVEVCDGVDNDCASGADNGVNLAAYTDADGDGYGDPSTGQWVCTLAADQVTDYTDCDDGVATTNPGATEVCDGVDNDCDSSTDEDVTVEAYADADGDGYGAGDPVAVCAGTAGYADVAGDCSDSDPTVNPGAPELCDGADNDCDGVVDGGVTLPAYVDNDGDGYGAGDVIEVCAYTDGVVEDGTDCDDTSVTTNPGAPELCDNSLDDNCDGAIDEGC